jgi:hypothetical protein
MTIYLYEREENSISSSQIQQEFPSIILLEVPTVQVPDVFIPVAQP